MEAPAASAMIDTHEALAYDEELAAGASPDLPFDKPEATVVGEFSMEGSSVAEEWAAWEKANA